MAYLIKGSASSLNYFSQERQLNFNGFQQKAHTETASKNLFNSVCMNPKIKTLNFHRIVCSRIKDCIGGKIEEVLPWIDYQ